MTKRRFTDEVEQEICRRYAEGESSDKLAKSFGVGGNTVLRAVRRNGLATKKEPSYLTDGNEAEIMRLYFEDGKTCKQVAAFYGVSEATIFCAIRRSGQKLRSNRALGAVQEEEVCRRYEEGESSRWLGSVYGLSGTSVQGLLKRHGVKRRSVSGYMGETVKHALDCTGRHHSIRDCSFYLFELANYASTHCKPGIAFDVDTRVRLGSGQYGTEVFRLIYGTRQEAYFLEQAVLDATRGSAHCPADLAAWGGASEVRAMPAEDMLPIVERLADELEELGMWAFAAAYVPMTAAQRATCQQRALANAPVLSSASAAE